VSISSTTDTMTAFVETTDPEQLGRWIQSMVCSDFTIEEREVFRLILSHHGDATIADRKVFNEIMAVITPGITRL
jgi:hypothetical protein